MTPRTRACRLMIVACGAALLPRAARAAVPVQPDSLAAAVARLAAGRPLDDGIDAVTWARVRQLYGLRGHRAAWVSGHDLDARAGALLAALRRAPEHGLRPGDYAIDAAVAAVTALRPAAAPDEPRPTAIDSARADVLLSAAFAAYGEDLLRGRVDARSVEPGWHVTAGTSRVGAVLARALEAPDLGAALARLAPQEEGYPALVAGLARYRAMARRGGWQLVEAGPSLSPGDSGARVRALRARLAAEELVSSRTAASLPHGAGAQFDTATAGAVARFQTRHGLAPDSVVGPHTLAALNVTVERRMRQIEANLERFRWLPRDLGDRYIVVNIPAFRLSAYEGDVRALTMRVVVGSELASRATPVFSDSMSYVQFGPYWNVPPGIAHAEILPLARKDRGYLARRGYELLRGWGADAPVVDPWTLSDAALRSGRYRVRQRPGPENALGRVKFMFPNDFNVYLHDTPAQALFDERVRAASHGCVRVARPDALARFVLGERADWTPDRIATTLATGHRERVALPRKLPVYLLYLTAFVRGAEVAFRPDVYGMDQRLMDALDRGR